MDIHDKSLSPLIKQIAEKHGVSPNTVRDIVTSQYAFVKASMKLVDSYNNFFPTIKIPYLCTVKVTKGRRAWCIRRSKNLIKKLETDETTQDPTLSG